MNIASKIPIEVLGEVFLHAIDGSISNVQDNGFPWAINRVCKYWRSAFVTSPDLWTWITINLAESYSRGQDFNAANQCLSLCLERSRNYPLNISLHLPNEGYDENSPSVTPIWQTFLSCSHRWRIVHLENVLGPQLLTINLCTGATPILESLTIYSPVDPDNYNDFTGFQIVPHLTRFTLVHPTAMFAVRTWSVPWMQLTNLMLRFNEIGGVDQLCVLFQQLRDIEELCLSLGGDEGEIELGDFVHNSGTPQCLQHLRVLQVCCVEIFGLITAPSLYELYLEGSRFFYSKTGDGDPYEILPEAIISSFIQRSGCKIHKLTLSDFSAPPFTPLVQLFPDVVELCLVDAVTCLRHLIEPNQFPGLRALDCTTHTINATFFMGILLLILQVHNTSSAKCSAASLEKVIFRPVLEDGEPSVLVSTTDWASFETYVKIGSWCVHSILTD
ncbi:hypothetical protein M378DRAFT_26859 [Amanita muscaria Koide BX008]|uniref:F-box domain-containing protein n=1 Tax=Amanita muscaria (strain Koide BX008) TaxID=946122 RepID=A0A0C2WTL4_AMAMK|nr:hypothetical protein M378DRAFT_26859 [Amanita muscaria Koide BX008]